MFFLHILKPQGSKEKQCEIAVIPFKRNKDGIISKLVTAPGRLTIQDILAEITFWVLGIFSFISNAIHKIDF